jgi:predicted transcriptional regulator YdeE
MVQYGPLRVIGMSYIGPNQNGEVPALWDGPDGFIARFGEVVSPPEATYGDSGRHPAFGMCRCVPGATDGTFEYIAAAPATADAAVPGGMVEARIPEATYAAFEVPSLAEIGPGWEAAMAWMGGHPEWTGYCWSESCDCASHPCFELYPPEFGEDGRLFIYMPVRPSA